MTTLNNALDTVMELSYDDRSELLDILNKRQADEWRQQTSQYHKELKKEILEGKHPAISLEDALEELRQLKPE
jgi:hypothetical protein